MSTTAEEESDYSVPVNTVPRSMDLVNTVQIPVSTVQILVMSMDLVQVLASTVPESTDLALTLVLHLASNVQTLPSSAVVPVSMELVPVTHSTQKEEPHSQTVNTRAAAVTESIHLSVVVARSHHCTLEAIQQHRGALVAEDTVQPHTAVALYHCMVADSQYCHCRPVVVLPYNSNTAEVELSVAALFPVGSEWVANGFDRVVATRLVTFPTR